MAKNTNTNTPAPAKRGRKSGSTNVPLPVTRAYILRTMGLPENILTDEMVAQLYRGMTTEQREELKSSPEFQHAEFYKIAEHVRSWETDTVRHYVRAILGEVFSRPELGEDWLTDILSNLGPNASE